MILITCEELKEKLDKEENFKLVNVLEEWNFRAKRIPGSIHLNKPEKAEEILDKKDEIVVYCTNVSCVASIIAYRMLVQNGYENVCRFAGGLEAWEEAGLPLEGEMVDDK
ncbi:MAG: rhodanese-like domain-containing protein [candidate division Zixibacteria bacterium]